MTDIVLTTRLVKELLALFFSQWFATEWFYRWAQP